MADIKTSFDAQLVPFIEKAPGGKWIVGADHPDGDYSGPRAEVYADREWIVVCTDDYEGHAMLNRAALPKLIEALQNIQREAGY